MGSLSVITSVNGKVGVISTADVQAAAAGSLSGLVKASGGTLAAAVAGADYLTPSGSGAGLAGISAGQVSGLGTAATHAATDFLAAGGTAVAATTAAAMATAVTADTLWGGNGTGAPTPIAVGSGLSLSGNTLAATGGGGGGGGSPGGTTGQLQYNDAGALGGFGAWDGNTLALQSDGTHASQQWKDHLGNVVLAVGPTGMLSKGADTFLWGDASDNLAWGTDAGSVSGAGSRNLAIGSLSLFALTTGSNNACLGAYSGSGITTGSSNIALGQSALLHLTTGSSNVAIGSSVMQSLTTGGNNIAIGGSALLNLTTSSGSIAIGSSALSSCTTGASNTAVGGSVFGTCSAGSNNTGVGDSVFGNATGNNNVGMGVQAGYFMTTGNNNTFLGTFTGGSATPTISTSIALGYAAQPQASNTCAIGGTGGNSVQAVINGVTAEGQLDVNPAATTTPGVVVNLQAGQSAPALKVKDSSANPLFLVRADGSLALPTLADAAAADGSLYFSSTTGKLTYKDAAGTLHAV